MNRSSRLFRSLRAVVAVCALAAGLGAVSGQAGAAEPESGFEACPRLPAGADPAAWRCEVMSATGHLSIGRFDEPIAVPITVTFAEGRMNGEFHQVFGELTASPIRAGRTPLTLTPVYAGYSDFLSTDERRGELDLGFKLSGPALPPGCAIGSDADPVHLVLKDTEPTKVISEKPLIVTFGARDIAFTAPRTSGCGRLGPALDKVLGLPSPSGSNAIDLDATVALRSYRELPHLADAAAR
ncbi:hypothetical protein [Streptomyces sp. NPDC018031]|uniref:hypothetical protein n=1 Tax=Streptomyces sp. NPDC018031 TaxID=3365033 RepID=UPI0037A8F9D8